MPENQTRIMTIKNMIDGDSCNAMPTAIGGAILIGIFTTLAITLTILFGAYGAFVLPVFPLLFMGGITLSVMQKNLNKEIHTFSFLGAPNFTKAEILKMILRLPVNKELNCGSRTLYNGNNHYSHHYSSYSDIVSGTQERSMKIINNRVTLVTNVVPNTGYIWENTFSQSIKGYIAQKNRKLYNV